MKERNFKFNINDLVKVIDVGQGYPHYKNWFYENNSAEYSKYFLMGDRPIKNNEYIIVARGGHCFNAEGNIYAIRKSDKSQVYLVNELGLERVITIKEEKLTREMIGWCYPLRDYLEANLKEGFKYLVKQKNGLLLISNNKPTYRNSGEYKGEWVVEWEDKLRKVPDEIIFSNTLETTVIYDFSDLRKSPISSFRGGKIPPTISLEIKRPFEYPKPLLNPFLCSYTPRVWHKYSNDIKLVYTNPKKRQVCIKWNDGTTTKSTCSLEDEFDFNVGFAVAFTRKFFKNDKALNKFLEKKKVKDKRTKESKPEQFNLGKELDYWGLLPNRRFKICVLDKNVLRFVDGDVYYYISPYKELRFEVEVDEGKIKQHSSGDTAEQLIMALINKQATIEFTGDFRCQ